MERKNDQSLQSYLPYNASCLESVAVLQKISPLQIKIWKHGIIKDSLKCSWNTLYTEKCQFWNKNMFFVNRRELFKINNDFPFLETGSPSNRTVCTSTYRPPDGNIPRLFSKASTKTVPTNWAAAWSFWFRKTRQVTMMLPLLEINALKYYILLSYLTTYSTYFFWAAGIRKKHGKVLENTRLMVTLRCIIFTPVPA